MPMADWSDADKKTRHRSSEHHHACMDGRVATEVDEVNTGIGEPFFLIDA